MEDVLTEIAKSSPFAAMCILFVIILSRSYNKNLDAIRELSERTIQEIRQVYQKVYSPSDKRPKTKV